MEDDEFDSAPSMYDLESSQAGAEPEPETEEIDAGEVEPESETTEDTEVTEELEEATDEPIEEPVEEPADKSDVGEFDLGALLETAPPPAPLIEAPADAQINEHGQKVWRGADGNVWVQNPDGSLLRHNELTGAWEPFEQ